MVPENAKSNGVKLRFWQLNLNDRLIEDWAIDSLVIDSPLNVSTAVGKDPLNTNPLQPSILESEDDIQMDQPAAVKHFYFYFFQILFFAINLLANATLFLHFI